MEIKNTQQKNPLDNLSKAQLRKKIEKAQMFIDKGADYKAVYFSDKGLGIHVCKHYVVVSRPFHDIVYARITGAKYSSTALYLESVVDIANKYRDDMQIKMADGSPAYSFDKLFGLSKLEEYEKILLNLFLMFILNLTEPLDLIGNTSFDMVDMLTSYKSLIAKNGVLFEERDKDMNRNDFFNKYISLFRYLSFGCNNLSDENARSLKENIDAIETEAYDKIKKLAIEMGGEIVDAPALKKNDMDEKDALYEQIINEQSKEDAAQNLKKDEEQK